MRQERDGLKLVRAALCERLAALENLSRRARPRDVVQSLMALRSLAASYDFAPVVHLADAVERALAEDVTSRTVVRRTALYLDRLHDAIGCESADDAVSQAMIASVSVRLGA
jgi:hypothetical protein